MQGVTSYRRFYKRGSTSRSRHRKGGKTTCLAGAVGLIILHRCSSEPNKLGPERDTYILLLTSHYVARSVQVAVGALPADVTCCCASTLPVAATARHTTRLLRFTDNSGSEHNRQHSQFVPVRRDEESGVPCTLVAEIQTPLQPSLNERMPTHTSRQDTC